MHALLLIHICHAEYFRPEKRVSARVYPAGIDTLDKQVSQIFTSSEQDRNPHELRLSTRVTSKPQGLKRPVVIHMAVACAAFKLCRCSKSTFLDVCMHAMRALIALLPHGLGGAMMMFFVMYLPVCLPFEDLCLSNKSYTGTEAKMHTAGSYQKTPCHYRSCMLECCMHQM